MCSSDLLSWCNHHPVFNCTSKSRRMAGSLHLRFRARRTGNKHPSLVFLEKDWSRTRSYCRKSQKTSRLSLCGHYVLRVYSLRAKSISLGRPQYPLYLRSSCLHRGCPHKFPPFKFPPSKIRPSKLPVSKLPVSNPRLQTFWMCLRSYRCNSKRRYHRFGVGVLSPPISPNVEIGRAHV